jgi:hypothetical protein
MSPGAESAVVQYGARHTAPEGTTVNRATFCLVLLLATGLAAGCSSSTKGTGSAAGSGGARTPAATGFPATTSGAAAGSAPDRATLARAVLTSADVPSDWTGSPSSNDDTPGPDADQAKLAACVGIPDSSPQQVAVADSDDFASGESTISSSATSYKSQSVVASDIRGILSPKAADCFAQDFQSGMSGQLPSGATMSDFKVSVAPGRNGGPSDVVAVIHASFVVHSSGAQVPFYIDSSMIASKQVEAEVDFFGFQTPIASSIQRTATDAVANRVAAL